MSDVALMPLFATPPTWADDAFRVLDRELQITWHLDLGGPCWFLSNGYLTLLLRSDGSKPFTATALESMYRNQLSPFNLQLARESSRDYPKNCLWGDVSVYKLRQAVNPERWILAKAGDVESRALGLVHGDGRTVVFNRELAWKALFMLPAETVSIAFAGKEDPIHFTAPGWRLIVMPMKHEYADLKKIWTWHQSRQDVLRRGKEERVIAP